MEGGQSRPVAPTYLGWSIFNTLCCCLPLGIAAIVYSCRVSNIFWPINLIPSSDLYLCVLLDGIFCKYWIALRLISIFTFFEGSNCKFCWRYHGSRGCIKDSQDPKYHCTCVWNHFAHHFHRSQSHTTVNSPAFCHQISWNFNNTAIMNFPSPSTRTTKEKQMLVSVCMYVCVLASFIQAPKTGSPERH